MAAITIRNIDDELKTRLRLQAAQHGCSMEQEVRHILQNAVAADQPQTLNFAQMVSKRFKGLNADDLPIPDRMPVRTPPDFSDA
jgi:plasmid stability protein